MKILFIDKVHPYLWESLTKAGHDCMEGYALSYDKVMTMIPSMNGLVIRSRIMIDQKLIDAGKQLKFIARAGSGMESIDVDYAEKHNIACLNAPEGSRDAVGEQAIGMLLSLFHNINRADKQVREGKWVREGNRGMELSGKTVGIIGYGNMGSAFAEKLSGFNCGILAYDKYKSEFGDSMVKESTMEEIYEQADIVSIHLPLTEETTNLVNSDFISRLRKKIIIVNTARGGCLNTDDLVAAMQSGKVLGACLDVIEYEEPSFGSMNTDEWKKVDAWQYLVNSERVILTPHIAGLTEESNEKIAQVLSEKISKLK